MLIKTKDKIEDEDGIDILIKHKGTSEKSRIFCDKIVYMYDKVKDCFDHHLMIYNGKDLIFKVWLPNESKDKKFKDVKEALESVDMEVLELRKENKKERTKRDKIIDTLHLINFTVFITAIILKIFGVF